MLVNTLELIQAIKNYQPISKNNLEKYLSIKPITSQFLLIPYLFFYIPISIDTYVKIKNYISYITNLYFSIVSYNETEQEWYKFYILLKVYKEPHLHIQEIVNDYKSLPSLNTNKEEFLWLQYLIKEEMLSYYMSLQLDYGPLLNEIQIIPNRIKRLQY